MTRRRKALRRWWNEYCGADKIQSGRPVIMDITEALNLIIFKYHLDKYYPHYRNMYEAKKILRRLVGEIISVKERVLFVCDEEAGNEIIQRMAGDCDRISFRLYIRNDLKTLEPIRQENFDRVYLTSFYGAEYALIAIIRNNGSKGGGERQCSTRMTTKAG